MLHRIIKFPKAYSFITRTYTARKPLGHNVSCPSVPSVPLSCECTEIQHLKKEITKLNYVVTYILCFSMINSLTLFSVVTTKTI